MVEQLSSATVSAAAAAAAATTADCVSTAGYPTSSVHVASAAAVSASVVTPAFRVLKLAAVAAPPTFARPAVFAYVGTIGVSSVPALASAGAEPQTQRALIERSFRMLQNRKEISEMQSLGNSVFISICVLCSWSKLPPQIHVKPFML